MLTLKCCKCGNNFEYTGYINANEQLNTFDKKCNECHERNRLSACLYNNGYSFTVEQFEFLYSIFKIMKENILNEYRNKNAA